MSIKRMTAVFDKSAQKGSPLLTLLSLADWSNDDGVSWYSMDKLSKRTRLTERQQRRLNKLLTTTCELHIEPNAGPHGTNLFFVLTGMSVDEMEESLAKALKMDHESVHLLALSIYNRGDKMSGGTFDDNSESLNVPRSVIKNDPLDLSADADTPDHSQSKSNGNQPDSVNKRKTMNRKPAANKALLDAIAQHVQGIDPTLAGRTTGYLAGAVTSVWRKRFNRLPDEKLSEVSYAMIAKTIEPFVKEYLKCNSSLKFIQHQAGIEAWYSKMLPFVLGEQTSEKPVNTSGMMIYQGE